MELAIASLIFSTISLIVGFFVLRMARRGFIESFTRKHGRKPTWREELGL